MKYFEKGQAYTYDEIATILQDAKKYVLEDLKKDDRKDDIKEEMDSLNKMLFELQNFSILSLYQCLLLHGKEEK